MTGRDDENVDETTDAQRPTPSPRAQAASRARRIGGRPQPGATARPNPGTSPKPAPGDTPAPADRTRKSDGTAVLDKPVGLDKASGKPPAPTSRGPLPAWLNWLPAAVLAAVIVLVLVLGVVASHGVWWAKKGVDTASQRLQVLAAAKSCMATMNTYDYRKLDGAEAKGVACTTGTFTAQYKTALEKLVKPQATKLKFTQAATVNNAGIESISSDGKQWVVLVFGQLSTTNSADGTTTPKLSIFSARVTMQPVKGHWLVANYAYAPSS